MRVLLATLILSLALPAQLSLVRLRPNADATADMDQPAVNFGLDPELRCGKQLTVSPTPRYWFTRGYLQFDLTPVSGLPLPDRARLRVYEHRDMGAGCLDVSAHRVTAPWSESTLSWQNMPTHDPTALATTCVGDHFDPGWKSFDVTATVRDWLSNTYPNFGLVVRDPTEASNGAARPLYCHSRETLTPALMPELEVSWGTFPFGTGCDGRVHYGVSGFDLEDGVPSPGQRYTLRAAGPYGSAAMLWFLGQSNTSWGGFPLPFDLAAAGFPGCFLRVSGQVLTTGQADLNGRASTTFAVPNDRALLGSRLYHQVAYVYLGPLAIGMTNGFQVTLL